MIVGSNLVDDVILEFSSTRLFQTSQALDLVV